MRTRPASDYEVMGKKVASRFLEQGASMNQTLQKLAADEDLNQHQIERVAEIANHAVFKERLQKHSQGEDIQFEKASHEHVVAQLNLPTKKIAFTPEDYIGRPESSQKVAMDDVLRREFGGRLAGLIPELEKRASYEEAQVPVEGDFATLKDFEKAAGLACPDPIFDAGTTFDTITKVSKVIEHFEVERIKIMDLAGKERQKFATLIERMVRAGHKVEDLYKAATLARPDQKDSLRSLFAWIISDLDKKAAFGGLKTAGSVDPKMISKRLDSLIPPHGVTVINGSHPVTLAVNIIADLATQWDDANKGLAIAQDALAKAQKVQTSIMPRKGSYFGIDKVRGL